MHPKYAALFTSVNLLLGAGPLIIPAPFFQAGFVLSAVWLFIILLISYTAALFIAQSMSKLYYIEEQRNKSSILTSENQNAPPNYADIATQSEIKRQLQSQQQKIQTYDHSQQLEILYGFNMRYVCAIVMTIYLGGTAITKCIMTAKTLSKVFQDVDVIGSLQFWLAIFFISAAAFSFRSIQKTAVLQAVIIGVRAVSILLLIGGALYLIISNGVKTLVPQGKTVANFDKFTEIFSNTVFSLMFHHSFPGIAGQVKNSSELKFFLRGAFIIAGVVLYIVPITAIMAFGSELGSNGTGDLKYYNFDFQDHIPVIYYFVSFYVFLNIAAMPVYVIVIRTNLLRAISPETDPKVISKKTLATTLSILVVVLLVSFFARNYIQIVLDFTGGIFGIIILFIFPAMQAWKARELTYKKGSSRNYIRFLPPLFIVIGILFLGFNLYEIIMKL